MKRFKKCFVICLVLILVLVQIQSISAAVNGPNTMQTYFYYNRSDTSASTSYTGPLTGYVSVSITMTDYYKRTWTSYNYANVYSGSGGTGTGFTCPDQAINNTFTSGSSSHSAPGF